MADQIAEWFPAPPVGELRKMARRSRIHHARDLASKREKYLRELQPDAPPASIKQAEFRLRRARVSLRALLDEQMAEEWLDREEEERDDFAERWDEFRRAQRERVQT